MMGAGDVRRLPTETAPAAMAAAGMPLAEDIARLNEEWREKRRCFRTDSLNSGSDGGGLTPSHLAPPAPSSLDSCEYEHEAVVVGAGASERGTVMDLGPGRSQALGHCTVQPPPAHQGHAPNPAADRPPLAPEDVAAVLGGGGTGVDGGLSAAAAVGDAEACRRILQRGLTDPSTCGPDGTSPLTAAALWGHCDVLQLLLSAQADPSQCNRKNKETALHCAALQEHGKACMLLLQAGADPSALDNRGATPCDFAACSEAVWPHFAAVGCCRPSKSDLIARGVIRRASSALEMELGAAPGGVVPEFSRPGSAYVVSALHPPRPGSAVVLPTPAGQRCLSRGGSRPIDILAEGDEDVPSTRPGCNGLQGLGL